MRVGKRDRAILFLVATLILGAIFEWGQYREYCRSSFCLIDRVYGRTFYVLTGFHGAHVMAGIRLLLINLVRIFLNHFHRGFNVG